MARYIAEHSLQKYQFVHVRPSQLAAASMYLALRMKKLGGWVSVLINYSFSLLYMSADADAGALFRIQHRLHSTCGRETERYDKGTTHPAVHHQKQICTRVSGLYLLPW